MRCSYCYNPDIVLGKGRLHTDVALEFLHSRSGLLQGVVLSGGECTLHPDIFPLLRSAKQYGFDVKVDTNGSRPGVLAALAAEGLFDYVALDFKAIEHRYHVITRSSLFSRFAESLSLLNAAGIPFEVRTTVHSDLINEADLHLMVAYLAQSGYEGNYYIKYFVNNVPTLESLPRSTNKINANTLSTGRVNVVVRG